MALISSELAEYTRHKDRNRARYRFVFDNRTVDIGPIFVADEAEANAKLAEIEAMAIEQAKKLDASALTDIVDSGEATKADVAKLFLQRAMSEPESYKAYAKLKQFNEYRIAQGYTFPQVKAALNIPDEQWDKIVARWQHLDANSATIEAYAAIAASDPGVN